VFSEREFELVKLFAEQLSRRLEFSRRVTRAEEADLYRIAGRSETTRRLRHTLLELSQGSAAVVLIGETGTGKTLLARTLHQLTTGGLPADFRWRPCAATDVLFPPRRPMSKATSRGVADLGDFALPGTLFLDDVAALSDGSRDHLLTQLGERPPLDAGPRIVIAIHGDPRALPRSLRKFKDTAARRGACVIEVAPLRERRDDIDEIADRTLNPLRQTRGLPLELSDDARAVLAEYQWPQNVRQLIKVLIRTALQTASVGISGVDIKFAIDEYEAVCEGKEPPPIGVRRLAHGIFSTAGRSSSSRTARRVREGCQRRAARPRTEGRGTAAAPGAEGPGHRQGDRGVCEAKKEPGEP
jgi:DNA-binding NtrC family response regulator